MFGKNKIIFGFLMCCFLITGCSSNKTTNREEAFDRNSMEKKSFINKDDGWVFEMQLVFEDKKKPEYSLFAFSGVNMKYDKMDNSNGKLLDENGNELSKISRSMPLAEDFSNLENELKIVRDYFNTKHFKTTISESDIADINLSYFTKEELIKAFNKAIAIKPRKLGKYANIPQGNCVKMNSKTKEVFQLSYLTNYGDLGVVNIEYFDQNGERLSDKVENGTASEIEIIAQENIDKLEDELVKENTIHIKHKIELGEDFDKKIDELLKYSFKKVEK